MTTPARRQYLRIKKEHEGEILLFRMGDFFETFDADARIVSRELEIALTSREMGRGQRVPLAGIPYHALEPYLAQLVKKGYRVAICEQVSDPATSRGLVDREVVRVVTPGTVVEDSLLDQKANNYLASVVVEGEEAGLAYVDITTSEFATSQFPLSHLSVELGRLVPSEILSSEDYNEVASAGTTTVVTALPPDAFDPELATETLIDHFGVASLEAFGCESLPLAAGAAGAIMSYLAKNQKASVGQITSLHTYSTSSYMVLDPQTRRNLELFHGGRWGESSLSLFSVLDHTKTPMGGRLLRQWLGQPLLDIQMLGERQEAVAWFHRSMLRRERLTLLLESVSDVERLMTRVRGSRATPRDLLGLAASLDAAVEVRSILQEEDSESVGWLARQIGQDHDVVQLIRQAISEDAPPSVGGGRVIQPGFSPDLDAIMGASRDAKSYIAELERTERERTGIKSLKVGYNKVFGYYIEISKSNLARAPAEYIRRQTLVGGERFITPDMKEYESIILNAQDRIDELESMLFLQVCRQVAEAATPIMATSRALAQVDVFWSLADVASRHGYVRPELDEGQVLDIRESRHPVVERMMPAGSFVPNDVRLSNADDQLVILTGPNMAGKSTYIRQVAIIVLMAQIGSFVPAGSASIGLVDRIFSRVGLQDDLAAGQSTFMVEMVETASILNHATSRSLIILDEIGRGTSTYDGLAIARAVAEFIHNHPKLGCKTLFATHFNELTHLAEVLPRVRNSNVAVTEDQGSVVFLRRIVPGGADKSYGVHVARLAGLPGSVVNRAWEVLHELENGVAPPRASAGARNRRKTPPAEQLPLLNSSPAAIDDLLGLDISSMTPLEAINALYRLQEQARQNGP